MNKYIILECTRREIEILEAAIQESIYQERPTPTLEYEKTSREIYLAELAQIRTHLKDLLGRKIIK